MNRTSLLWVLFIAFILVLILVVVNHHNQTTEYTPLQVIETILFVSDSLELDPCLALSICCRESRFKQNVRGGMGELGTYQILESTGRDLGYSVSDLKNLRLNVIAGCEYLKYCLAISDNNISLAAASFNVGPRRIKQLGYVPSYCSEYVSDVLRLYQACNEEMNQ